MAPTILTAWKSPVEELKHPIENPAPKVIDSRKLQELEQARAKVVQGKIGFSALISDSARICERNVQPMDTNIQLTVDHIGIIMLYGDIFDFSCVWLLCNIVKSL